MIRLIIRELASDHGGETHHAWKTFDVNLPEVEEYLSVNIGYVGSGSRAIAGAEIIKEAK